MKYLTLKYMSSKLALTEELTCANWIGMFKSNSFSDVAMVIQQGQNGKFRPAQQMANYTILLTNSIGPSG